MPLHHPKWAIILLQWNNGSETIECLESLKKITYPHFEIILVDNGSTDGSLEKVRNLYPQLQFVSNSENLGFAEGNNRGISLAKERGAEMILLLNNDTVVAPDLLEVFSKASVDYPEAGVFGAKIYFYDEPATLWYAGGEVDQKTGRCFHIGCGKADTEKKYNQLLDTGYACGCALAFKTSLLEMIGYLDPQYFLIWEEIDFCKRITSAGLRCLFVPGARVWHKVSASFIEGNRGPMWQYYYFRNRLLFLRTHDAQGKWKFSFFLETLYLLKTFLSLKQTSLTRRQASAALWGIWDAHMGNFGKGRLAKFTQKSSS